MIGYLQELSNQWVEVADTATIISDNLMIFELLFEAYITITDTRDTRIKSTGSSNWCRGKVRGLQKLTNFTDTISWSELFEKYTISNILLVNPDKLS